MRFPGERGQRNYVRPDTRLNINDIGRSHNENDENINNINKRKRKYEYKRSWKEEYGVKIP